MRRLKSEMWSQATGITEDSSLVTFYYSRDIDADTDKPDGPWHKIKCYPLAPVVDCGPIAGDPPGYAEREAAR